MQLFIKENINNLIQPTGYINTFLEKLQPCKDSLHLTDITELIINRHIFKYSRRKYHDFIPYFFHYHCSELAELTNITIPVTVAASLIFTPILNVIKFGVIVCPIEN